MAHTPQPVTQPPVTEDMFLRDRERFWSGFCRFVVVNVISIVVLLALLAFFFG